MSHPLRIQAITYEVEVYEDGTSAVSLFERGPLGHLTYVGRDFRDTDETARILATIRQPRDAS